MSAEFRKPAAFPRLTQHRNGLLAAGLGLAWTLGCSVYEDSLLSNEFPSTDAGRGGTVAGHQAAAGRGSEPVGGASVAGTTSGSGGFSSQTGVAGDGGSEGGEGGAPEGAAGSTSVGGGGSGGKAGAGSSGGGNGGAGSGGAGGGAGGSGGSAGAPRELATGRPATASSSQPDHTVGQGNDGNPTSRWAATNNTFPQWWRVDLGASRHVISVTLRPEHADRTYSYLVETSTNDNLYTEQRDTSGTGAVHNVDLPANVQARYVRITLTASSAGNGTPWASFFELAVTGN
jgi:hypothetical protein